MQHQKSVQLPARTYQSLLTLFFLSGLAALTYEVLWLRWFSMTLGSSTISLTIILMAFMAGLALGSWRIGLLADRISVHQLPLLFVGIEVGIGLYALILPELLEWVETLYVEIYRYLLPGPWANSMIRGATSLLLLLIPTTLMGGSLPVVTRYLNHISSTQSLSVDISRLYSLNTFGAITGTLLTGYLFLAHLGIAATNVLAAMINFLVAAILWFYIARHYRDGRRPELPEPTIEAQMAEREERETNREKGKGPAVAPLSPAARRLLLISYGLSGMAAFIYEIAWTRTLEMILGTTTYAFTVMLATFLFGIALGSAIYRHISPRISRMTLYLSLQMVVVVSALFSSLWLDQFPLYYLKIHADLFDTWFGVQFMRFFLTSLVMLIPTTAMGILFPTVAALTVSDQQKAGGIGTAYGVNTVGAAVGAAMAGLVLIPLIGMQQTIIVGATVNLLVVLLVLFKLVSWTPLLRLQGGAVAVSIVAIMVVMMNPWGVRMMNSGVYLYADNYYDMSQRYNRFMEKSDLGEPLPRDQIWLEGMRQFKVQYYDTGRGATVAVMDNKDGVRSLVINGKTDASAHEYATLSDLRTQEMLTHLSLLMAPKQENVFVVGLGSGITAGSALNHPVNNVHVAEISPAVIEAAHYFDRFNNNLLSAERVSIFQMDARQRLRVAERGSYDVVISQPSNPWIRGESMLFTEDWYQLVKSRLSDQGMFAQWIPAYNISPRNLKVIIHTLNRVFPNLTVWTTGTEGDVILLANKDDAYRINYAQVVARTAERAVQGALVRMQLDPVRFFFNQFVMGPQEIRKYLQRGIRHPLHANTDDLLITEYRTPKDMVRGRTADYFLGLEPDDFSTDSLLRVTDELDRERIQRYRLWVEDHSHDGQSKKGAVEAGWG